MDDRSKRLLWAFICIAVAVLLYLLSKPQPRGAAPIKEPAAAEPPRTLATPPPSSAPSADNSPAPSLPSGPAETVSQQALTPPAVPATSSVPPSDPDGPAPGSEPIVDLPADPAQDLSEVQGVIRDFRNALGENPVGTNAEITAALLGDNLKQVKLPVPSGSRVSEDGELVDRWGTPYFFHQLSAREMEIRSAGPDRKMWTGDDRQAR